MFLLRIRRFHTRNFTPCFVFPHNQHPCSTYDSAMSASLTNRLVTGCITGRSLLYQLSFVGVDTCACIAERTPTSLLDTHSLLYSFTASYLRQRQQKTGDLESSKTQWCNSSWCTQSGKLNLSRKTEKNGITEMLVSQRSTTYKISGARATLKSSHATAKRMRKKMEGVSTHGHHELFDGRFDVLAVGLKM